MIKDIEEYVSLHYSMPRRDITNFLFKASIKEMKRQLSSSFKEAFQKEERFKGHPEYLGKMQAAVIHLFFTGHLDYKRHSLPRNLVVRAFIMSLYPIVVERIHHVSPDRESLQQVYEKDEKKMEEGEIELKKKKKKVLRKILFGLRFKYGESSWSRIFYQSDCVIEKGYARYTSTHVNSPQQEAQDKFGLTEYESEVEISPFKPDIGDQDNSDLDKMVGEYLPAPCAEDNEGKGKEIRVIHAQEVDQEIKKKIEIIDFEKTMELEKKILSQFYFHDGALKKDQVHKSSQKEVIKVANFCQMEDALSAMWDKYH
jgi:hypothetical protein